jgi:hypothetical protein
MDLDPRIFLLEIGGELVDDLGDRPADGNRVVERNVDRRLREGQARHRGGGERHDPARNGDVLHRISSS